MKPTSPIVAQWQYTPDDWRKFGAYEGRHYRKLIEQTKKILYALIVLVVIALAVVPIFGLLGWAYWDSSMLVAVFLILFFGGGLIGLSAIVWSMQSSKLSSLNTDRGEVIVTLTGINTNGIWHNWNYNEVLGQRFLDARTMTIKEGMPDAMDLLEVRTVANTVGANSNRNVVTSCRVPIPAGKRLEADQIVEMINDQKRRTVR